RAGVGPALDSQIFALAGHREVEEVFELAPDPCVDVLDVPRALAPSVLGRDRDDAVVADAALAGLAAALRDLDQRHGSTSEHAAHGGRRVDEYDRVERIEIGRAHVLTPVT